jgi:hypothetical protein
MYICSSNKPAAAACMSGRCTHAHVHVQGALDSFSAGNTTFSAGNTR